MIGSSLGGGDLLFIAEGTDTIRYELSDLSITLPDGVGGFNLWTFSGTLHVRAARIEMGRMRAYVRYHIKK